MQSERSRLSFQSAGYRKRDSKLEPGEGTLAFITLLFLLIHPSWLLHVLKPSDSFRTPTHLSNGLEGSRNE